MRDVHASLSRVHYLSAARIADLVFSRSQWARNSSRLRSRVTYTSTVTGVSSYSRTFTIWISSSGVSPMSGYILES